ncbi:unnamed protein product, partial [Staurois parvus]
AQATGLGPQAERRAPDPQAELQVSGPQAERRAPGTPRWSDRSRALRRSGGRRTPGGATGIGPPGRRQVSALRRSGGRRTPRWSDRHRAPRRGDRHRAPGGAAGRRTPRRSCRVS